MKLKNFILLFFVLFFASCVSLKQNLKVSQKSYCISSTKFHYDSIYIPQENIDIQIKNHPKLLENFSYQDILLSNASGSLPLLIELVTMRNKPFDDEDSLYYMLKKQQVFNRLLLASIELAGLSSELDCESERSKQVANYLDQINDTRVQQLTIASVVIGAATGVGTSIFQNYASQLSIGISGSIVSAIFGGLAVISSHEKAVFLHERNLLSSIWYSHKNQNYFPPFVWYLLNNKEFSGTEKSTIQILKELWVDENLFDQANQRQINLLFGSGGRYKTQELYSRTTMLNQLKVHVRTINQNLQSFMLKLSI
ncbi:MAG: hypothetical protein JSU07_00095 [Bacteroidetes bacterium]|nr:hypothetical protein [Bacteroidota bacterium]